MVPKSVPAGQSFVGIGSKSARLKMTLTLDQAIESAKLQAGSDRIIHQQAYELLLQKLDEKEKYPFTLALAELNIGPRTSYKEASAAVSAFLMNPSVTHIIASNTGLDNFEIENLLVHAAMHKDAQWWQNLKNKFKDWWNQGPPDEQEEEQEFADSFPDRDPGTDDMYDTEPVEMIGPETPADTYTPETDYQPAPQFAPEVPEPAYYDPALMGPPQEVPEGPESIEFLPVDSSNLSAIGYDGSRKELYIKFKSKRSTPETMYKYSDVDMFEFEALKAAPSKGRYFSEFIKNSKPYVKVQ
jgi:hypothetical protein